MLLSVLGVYCRIQVVSTEHLLDATPVVALQGKAATCLEITM